MTALLQDLRLSVRTLSARPGFALTVVAVLALGIGANVALFSLAKALLADPPPGVHDPESLVFVGRVQDGEGFDTFGWPELADYRGGMPSLSELAAFSVLDATVSTDAGAERRRTILVTGNYFETLGIRPAAGRLLVPADSEQIGETAVAVLRHGLAESLFGSPAAAVGRTVRVNGTPVEVVGVTPPGFRGHDNLQRQDAWLPITLQPRVMAMGSVELFEGRGSVWIELLGRLAPEATFEQARTEAGTVAARLRAEWPEEYEGRDATVSPGLAHPYWQERLAGFLSTLRGAVAVLLLVACANVAGLLLVRGTERRQEIGVRLALGGGRGRLVRQVLTESVALAAAGGAVGLMLAAWSGDALAWLLASSPIGGAAEVVDLTPDLRVAGFAALLALACGVVAGLVPALAAVRPDILGVLKLAPPTASRGSSRTRDAFVVAQLALSLVLLTACGLQLRSLLHLSDIDPGFDVDHVLVAGLQLGSESYSSEQSLTFYDRLLERVEALPAVETASLGFPVPLYPGRISTNARIDGWEPPEGRDGFNLDFRPVTPGYFQTLGLSLLQGRSFAETDRDGAPKVAVINQTLAERFWPDGNPLGQHLHTGDEESLEIVGVVSDMKYRFLTEEPRLHFYIPLAQSSFVSRTALHVRTAPEVDPLTVLPSVRAAVTELDPDVPLDAARTLKAQWLRSMGASRFATSLTGGFAGLAVLLAGLGLYGAFAFYVRQRQREIGIRMALGAEARRVEGLVLRQGVARLAVGIVLGLIGALFAARWLAGDLAGVTPTDPVALLVAPAVLAAVAVVATWLPAWRAARIEPAEVLRGE